MTNKWMTKLTKDFGNAAADMLSPSDHVIKMPSPSLNWAVGNGGFTRGKAICMFGPESGGKSLLMYLTFIQLQRDFPDGICVLFDSEYSFNKDWFAKLGGDNDRLYLRQTNDPLKIFDYIEGEMLEKLQDGCPIVGLGIDSVKAIRFPKDHKKKTTDQTMGGSGAPYLGPALKGVLPIIRDYEITTILVQQVYMEMDEYKKMSRPYIVPDGFALKHFCDYMLQVERLDTKAGRIEEGKNIAGNAQQVGHILRIKAQKNRVGAPFRTAQLALNYNQGIVDIGKEVFELAKSLGVIYHPVNPETGKINSQMWKFGEHDAIKGEANIENWVLLSTVVQNEIMKACYSIDDEAVLAARNAELTICDIEIDPGDL